MKNTAAAKLRSLVERAFPEQRLFLRSDTETRFIRLSPMTQLVGITGSAVMLGWTIISSAILLMHSLGAGDLKQQALRDQAIYEQRLNQLASERDARAREAAQAQDRFAIALAEVSAMQSRLLASENRRKELETGVDVIAGTLRTAMQERDAARDEVASLMAELVETTEENPEIHQLSELESTLGHLSTALADLAGQRDEMKGTMADAELALDRIALDSRLEAERNERIFTQIEEAVASSLVPIDEMFSAAGLVLLAWN